jgi:hypothetical protein
MVGSTDPEDIVLWTGTIPLGSIFKFEMLELWRCLVRGSPVTRGIRLGNVRLHQC